MAIFGVASFFIGVMALALLVTRRGRRLPQRWPDHLCMFIGVAGVIIGLAVVFMRFG